MHEKFQKKLPFTKLYSTCSAQQKYKKVVPKHLAALVAVFEISTLFLSVELFLKKFSCLHSFAL